MRLAAGAQPFVGVIFRLHLSLSVLSYRGASGWNPMSTFFAQLSQPQVALIATVVSAIGALLVAIGTVLAFVYHQHIALWRSRYGVEVKRRELVEESAQKFLHDVYPQMIRGYFESVNLSLKELLSRLEGERDNLIRKLEEQQGRIKELEQVRTSDPQAVMDIHKDITVYNEKIDAYRRQIAAMKEREHTATHVAQTLSTGKLDRFIIEEVQRAFYKQLADTDTMRLWQKVNSKYQARSLKRAQEERKQEAEARGRAEIKDRTTIALAMRDPSR